MARFRFRLATLRRLREIRRDELRARVAEAVEAERVLNQQAAGHQQQLESLLDLRRSLVQNGHPDMNQLLAAQRYAVSLQAELRTLGDRREQVRAELEKRRLAAADAERQVRVLDKLEEKQRREHRRAAEVAEIAELDEIAGRIPNLSDSEVR